MSWSFHHNSRPWLRLCALLTAPILLLVLSACADVEFRSEFERDGTGRHSFAVTFPREAFEDAEDDGASRTVDLIREQSAETGLRVERTLFDDEVTLTITAEDEIPGESGAALNTLLNSSGINANPGISAPFNGDFRRTSSAVGGSSFSLDMTANGDELAESLAVLNARTQQGLSNDELINVVSVEYVATTPGEITETNGEIIEGNTVRWDIPLSGMTSIQATSSLSDSSSSALFIALSIAAAGLMIVAALVMTHYLRQRAALANRLSAAAGHFPTRRIFTGESLWVSRKVRDVIERVHPDDAAEQQEACSVEPGENRDEDSTLAKRS